MTIQQQQSDAQQHDARASTPRFTKAWKVPLGPKLCFIFNPWISAVFLIVLAIMLRLGIWQLDRRALKIDYNNEVAQFLAQHDSGLNYRAALEAFDQHGKRASDVTVTLSGKFIKAPVIFHDNRVHNMQAGLHALGLFKPKASHLPAVLINLGWLPWPAEGRPHLPDLALPSGTLQIQGLLFAPNPETWSLEQIPPPPTSQGWLVQKLTLEHIATQLQIPLAPFTLRLTPDSAPTTQMMAALLPIRDFPPTTDWRMTPEKHLGYAAQWIALSVVLCGLYVGLNIRRKQ